MNQGAADEHDMKFFSANESDCGEYRNSAKFKTFTPVSGKNLLAICNQTQEFIFYLPASKSVEKNLNGDLRVSGISFLFKITELKRTVIQKHVPLF